MELILLAIAAGLVVRWVIIKVGNSFIPKDNFDYTSETKESPTTIKNYYNENHLHVSKEDLKDIADSKPE